MTSILIVCTANMSRSPMAEALLSAEVAARGHDWVVRSAGTEAVAGTPASRTATKAVAELGLDMSGHQTAPVRRELLQDSTIVLAMEQRHIDDIVRNFGPELPPVFLFHQLIGQTTDVEDPIGRPIDDFIACARGLQTAIRSGFAWLERTVENAENSCGDS